MNPQDRAPTRAELDAIPVSPEEVAAQRAHIHKVRTAMDRERIPVTADWAYVMLSLAVSTAVVTRMHRDFFGELVGVSFECAAEEAGPGPHRPVHVYPIGDMKAKVNRLAMALARHKVRLVAPETTQALLHCACGVFARGGLPKAKMVETAKALHDQTSSVAKREER